MSHWILLLHYFQNCNSTVFVYKKATTSFEFCSHSKTFFLELTHHEKLCNRSYIQASNAYNNSKTLLVVEAYWKNHTFIFLISFDWKFYFDMEHCCLLATLEWVNAKLRMFQNQLQFTQIENQLLFEILVYMTHKISILNFQIS